MADLLEAMPEDAHPGRDDGPADRLEAINDLTQVGAMILPLRYYDIANSGASRRRMMVCNGDVTPHDGEDDLSIDDMVANLIDRGEETEIVHGHLSTVLEAISRIQTACLTASKPHTPQLQNLTNEVNAVLAVIASANPELASDSDSGSVDDADTPSAGGATGGGPAPVATEVKDHDEARRRLVAVETYFGLKEPSSACVLMVTQARLLIGKSLIDAFDILAPNTADRAKVDFISDNGFALAHGQLRSLADEVRIEEVDEP